MLPSSLHPTHIPTPATYPHGPTPKLTCVEFWCSHISPRPNPCSKLDIPWALEHEVLYPRPATEPSHLPTEVVGNKDDKIETEWTMSGLILIRSSRSDLRGHDFDVDSISISTHVDPFGSIWAIQIHMDPYGSIWICLGPYGSLLWIHTNRYRSVWIHMSHTDPYGAIQIHMEPLWIHRPYGWHLPSSIRFRFGTDLILIQWEIHRFRYFYSMPPGTAMFFTLSRDDASTSQTIAIGV